MAGEWFFSTLAQVSAAVVGFIIAITMVAYSLEKERKMNRTAEFRDHLEGFYQIYKTLFDSVQAQLSKKETDDYVFRDYGSENLRDELFTSEFTKHPVPIQFYILSLHLATTVFHEIRPSKPEVPEFETIQSVGEAVARSNDILQDEDASSEIYELLTDSDEVPDDFMRRKVFDPVIVCDGRKIESLEELKDVVSEMEGAYLRLQDRFPAVYSEYATGAYDILNISVYLVTVGAFLPTLSLLTPTNMINYRISSNLLSIYQIFLLFSTAATTFVLIDLVRSTIKSGPTQSEEPRWLTQKVVSILPSII